MLRLRSSSCGDLPPPNCPTASDEVDRGPEIFGLVLFNETSAHGVCLWMDLHPNDLRLTLPISGYNPLHCVCKEVRLEKARVLLEYRHAGAALNKKNAHGQTPLMLAALANNTALFRLFMETADDNGWNLDMNSQIFPGGPTILLDQAVTGNVEIVRMLLSHAGTDIGYKDRRGMDALHLAIYYGQPECEVARLILQAKNHRIGYDRILDPNWDCALAYQQRFGTSKPLIESSEATVEEDAYWRPYARLVALVIGTCILGYVTRRRCIPPAAHESLRQKLRKKMGSKKRQ